MILKRKEPLLVQSGLVLGLLALGNLLGSFNHIFRYIFAGLALVFFLHLLVGMVTHGKQVRNQLKNPLIASVFPTFFMQGMLASTYLASWTFLGTWTMSLARFLWWISFISLVLLMIYYFFSFVIPMNFSPVWLFDLDNTLHNADAGIFYIINRAMTDYMAQRLKLSEEAASDLRQDGLFPF